MRDFKVLWSLLDKKDKKKFNILIILFIIQSFLEVIGIASVIPFITAIFNPEKLSSYPILRDYTDYLAIYGDQLLLISSIIFFGIFVLKNLSYIFTYKVKNFFINDFRATIAKKILLKYLSQDFLFFSQNRQGKLSNVIGSETQNLANNFLDPIIILISEVMILLAIFLLIILSGYYKGLIVILPILIFTGFILRSVNRKIKSFSFIRVNTAEKMQTLTQRIFIGIRDIFLSSNAINLVEKFYLYLKKQADIDSNNTTYQMFPKALLELAGLFVLLVLVIYFSQIGVDKNSILTNLTFYFVVAYKAIPSYNKILIQYQRITYSQNSLNIIKDTLSMGVKRSLVKLKNSKSEFRKSIELKNLSFSYENGNKILENINLKINRGQIIGICGESGSGKSTLLNLITLLIKPDEGGLYLDDKLLNENNQIKVYQDLIRFISQDTFLIDDNIKNNIIFYSQDDKDLDENRLDYAIKFSQLDKVIDSFPGKLDHLVGSHSRRISSGQKQRIAMARAMYNAKDILIFDEATNALDLETEQKIISNIFQLKDKHTIILVSHEMRNLEGCDVIYKVKNGRIESNIK